MDVIEILAQALDLYELCDKLCALHIVFLIECLDEKIYYIKLFLMSWYMHLSIHNL